MAQTRKNRLRQRRSTGSTRDFQYMVRHFRNRVNVVAEGDSWFDYPRKYVIAGKPANIIDHVQRWGFRHINLLRLASNADEATEMLSGGQRHRLTKLLHECSTRSILRPVDTMGTLTSKNQWLNEIHPTSGGFKKIAKKVYAQMRSLSPTLPAPSS